MTMEEVIERNTGMSLKAFLTPQPNPYIHNMDRAVYFFKKKVNDAAEKKEILQIKIVGDYDADGMNASAILYDAIISYLKANSLAEYAEVSVRLPRRYSEGYGLSEKIIDESESGLIITVDNGIAAIDAIKKAKDKGIDVIILDHHLGGEKLLCADIIVDPHCEGMSTFKHYCGAGLAYRFAEMLITNKDLLDKLLVLAGIATVADVVPLIGANRYLVRQSLKLINRGIATSGVLALVRKMRLEKITAEDYGYKIGPVCNASGRLLDDGAMDIFHLLSQELDVFALDYDEQLLKLHSLADTVIERNVERRRITEEALERSDALISQQCKADDAVYRFCGFTGYAQFPNSKNKYVYKNINGVRTLLDKKAEENAWRIDGDMSVELYDTKLKQISEFSFFGHSIYPDSNLFFKGLTTILPDTGFITGTEKTAMDIDPDTRANTITDIKKISYDADDTKRYTQNSNTLNDLQFVRQSIAEDNACILASLMSAERGEYIVLIYGYDYEGNLLCADNSTGQRIGTIQITEKAKKILNKSGEIVSISYFDFKGFGFNSISGDRISFFASADGSQTSESNFSKEAISEKQDDTDAEKEATPTSSATPTPSPDVSEQPVLSESEQTKTSEKSDLTTKEAREQMQIDQMEDDSADHPEE